MYKLWETLEELKKLKWVELSHSLNNDSPYWSGIPEGSVDLCRTYLTGATLCWNV